MLYQVHLASAGFELTILVVTGTDCTGSCKSNYHTITIKEIDLQNTTQKTKDLATQIPQKSGDELSAMKG
jgi:hypothetical protein